MQSSTNVPEAGQHIASFIVASVVLWAMMIILFTVTAGFALLALILAVVVTGWTVVVGHARWTIRRSTKS